MIRRLLCILLLILTTVPAVAQWEGDPVQVDETGVAFALINAPDGELFALLHGDGVITIRRSSDGGSHWTTWVSHGDPNDPVEHLAGYDAVYVSQGADRILVAYRQTFQTAGNVITFDAVQVAVLDPAAATPSWDITGVDAAFSDTFGAIALATDASLHADWYLSVAYERGAPGARGLWFARSTDQAASMETPYQLAPPPAAGSVRSPDVTTAAGDWVHVVWEESGAMGDPLSIRYRGADQRGASSRWDGVYRELASGERMSYSRGPSIVAKPGTAELLVTAGARVEDGLFTLDGMVLPRSANAGRDWGDPGLGIFLTQDHPFYDADGLGILCHWSGGDQVVVLRPVDADPDGDWTSETIRNTALADLSGPVALQPYDGRLAYLDRTLTPDGYRELFHAEWFGDSGYPRLLADLPDGDGDLCLTDLEGDGLRDLLWVDPAARKLHAYDGHLDPRPGFPVTLGRDVVAGFGHVAAGDVNGDGEQEIFVTTAAGIKAYDSQGRPHEGQWPVLVNGAAPRFVSLAQVTGLAHLDVIAAAPGAVTVLRADGSTAGGFPVLFNPGDGEPGGPVAAADLDGDGDTELVVGLTHAVKVIGLGTSTTTTVWSDPTRELTTAVVLGAMAGESGTGTPGVREIIFSAGDQLHVVLADGTPYGPAWPWTEPAGRRLGQPTAVQDFVAFSPLEIFVATAEPSASFNVAHSLQWDGAESHPTWPQTLPAASVGQPLAGWHLAQYGWQHLFMDAAGNVDAFVLGDAHHPAWPLEGAASGTGTGVLEDLDGDGMLELVLPGTLRVYSLNSADNGLGLRAWPQGGYDAWRTGCLDCTWDDVVAVGDGLVRSGAGALAIRALGPNPSNGPTTVSFALAAAGEVDVRILDVRGRAVRSVLQGGRDAGEHVVVWDGCDERGRAAPSGVYFARVGLRRGGAEEVRVARVVVGR